MECLTFAILTDSCCNLPHFIKWPLHSQAKILGSSLTFLLLSHPLCQSTCNKRIKPLPSNAKQFHFLGAGLPRPPEWSFCYHLALPHSSNHTAARLPFDLNPLPALLTPNKTHTPPHDPQALQGPAPLWPLRPPVQTHLFIAESLLVLENAKHVSTSNVLYLLYPLSGIFFPQTPKAHAFTSFSCCWLDTSPYQRGLSWLPV